MKYYYLYQITNLINGKIYIGVHKTENLNDKYMGSGTQLLSAYTKYGKENFKKNILEYFTCSEDMFNKEVEIVNDNFVLRSDVYNIVKGGLGGDKGSRTLTGRVTVKDKDNNYFSVLKTDTRYLSGELIPAGIGKVVTKDKYGKIFRVDINDPRYLSGQLVSHWTGSKHSEETKKKIGIVTSKAQKGKGNSQYGKMWITNLDKTEEQKIKKNLSIPKGWNKGRKKNCHNVKN